MPLLAEPGPLFRLSEERPDASRENKHQPIGATVTNAQAALRWLGARTPDLDEVREALDQIIKDCKRASDVISRIRALVKKAPRHKDRLEINEAVLEVVGLIQNEMAKNGISVQTQLAEILPAIQGDRVQLQQVVLNLLIQSKGAVEVQVICLAIGTRGVVYLKFTVIELQLLAQAALFFEHGMESFTFLLRHWSIGCRSARSEDQAQKDQYTTHNSLALIGWLRMCLVGPIKFRVSLIFVPSDV